MDDKLIKNAGNAVKVQQRQVMSAEEQMLQMKNMLGTIKDVNDSNLNELDLLLEQAEQLCSDNNISVDNIEKADIEEGLRFAGIDADEEIEQRDVYQIDTVDTSGDWDDYMRSVEEFARTHSIDLAPDPYMDLLSQSQITELKNRVQQDYYAHSPKMDKWDYITAAFCGVAAGIIDSLFVGMPGDSKLGNCTDNITDEFVKKVSKMLGWNPPDDDKSGVGYAIKYLEDKFKINYDQSTGSAAANLFDMAPKNHHIKSLSHSPDIIGLIFSVIDQFCSTSHFLDNGRLIVFDTDKYTLIGSNFAAKLFAGVCNWFFHCISDVAGSKSRIKTPQNRGSGLAIPFFELFQMLNVDSGVFDDKGTMLTIADTAVKMFEAGYDARFGAAMAIPVVINDLAVRMIWLLKRHFYHKEPLKECIPIVLLREIADNQSNAIVLRRMLLASQGTMCLIDFGDAYVRTGHVIDINFLLRLNFVAWKTFAVNLAITGVMEMRLNYNKTHLNVKKLDEDLQKDWERLYLTMN
jgi:hypothetical protein